MLTLYHNNMSVCAAIDDWRSIGATVFAPFWLSHLPLAYAGLGKLDDAWRTVYETITAIETSEEKWCEAENQSHCRRNRAQVAGAGYCESACVFRARSFSRTCAASKSHGNFALQ